MFDERISFNLPRGYEFIEEPNENGDTTYSICYGASIDEYGETRYERSANVLKKQKKGSLVSNVEGNFPVRVAGFSKDFNIGLTVGSSGGLGNDYRSDSQIVLKVYTGLAAVECDDQYCILTTIHVSRDDYESRSEVAEDIASELTEFLRLMVIDGEPLQIKPISKSVIMEELRKDSPELKTIDETPEEKSARLEKERVEREKREEKEKKEREARLERERKEREARKKAEEEKRKAEEERKRLEEEKRKLEEEKARKAAEEARVKAEAERQAMEKARLEARDNQSRALADKNAEIENLRIKELSDWEADYKDKTDKIESDLSEQTTLLKNYQEELNAADTPNKRKTELNQLIRNSEETISLLEAKLNTLNAENDVKRIQINIDAEQRKTDAIEEVRALYPIRETAEEKELKSRKEKKKRDLEKAAEAERIEKEQKVKAEEEKRIAEEKKQKWKKTAIVAGACGVAVVVIVLICVFVVRPGMKYVKTGQTIYYSGQLRGEKDDFHDSYEIGNVVSIEQDGNILHMYASLSKTDEFEDVWYEEKREYIDYAEYDLKLADTVAYYGVGGAGPREEFTEEEFYEICELYNGLTLILKIENGVVTEAYVAS